MLNIINNLVEMLNNEKERVLTAENPITKNEVNEYGLILLRNNQLLKHFNVVIGCLSVLDFDGNEDYDYMIAIDNGWDGLEEETKKFVIAHELGHKALHVNQMVTGIGRDISLEYEADEFAAKIIGVENTIEALEDVKFRLYEISFGANKYGMEEIDTRISHLRNKFMVIC
jgi:hypothetical protein